MRRIWIFFLIMALLAPAAWAGDVPVDLTWDANTEPDLNHYHLYWALAPVDAADPYPNGPIVVPKAPSPSHSITITVDENTEGTIEFQVTAVDTSGNESGRSNVTTRDFDFLAPSPPQNLR